MTRHAGLVALALLGGCSFFSTSDAPEDTGVADTSAVDIENDADASPDCVPADEVCDGIDNDCDGDIDEDPVDGTTYYRDADEDGQGNALEATRACSRPVGYVVSDTDCNDTSSAVFVGATELCDGVDNDCSGQIDDDPDRTVYLDADGDGYGDPANARQTCVDDADFVEDATDCDDTRIDDHPGAAEYCDDRDNDCDGTTDEDPGETNGMAFYRDQDGDGYGVNTDVVWACALPTGYVALDGDCDDTVGDVHPGATEVCSDETDWNCDGNTGYVDEDNDGVPACEDCDDHDAGVSPLAEEVCDGVDNDCDSAIDEDVRNACGGCEALEGAPGEVCGDCGEYVCVATALTCDDPGSAFCAGHGSCGWTDEARTCVCDAGYHAEDCVDSCFDGVRNGDELDVDCGPACGAPCHPHRVAAGEGFSCGIADDGALSCVGLNSAGRAQPPRGTFTDVVAGTDWACALDESATPVCWGTMAEDTPAGPSYAIAAGAAWVCVLAPSGEASCATRGGEGELHRTPSGPFVELAVGRAHACGRRVGGEVVCWGDNAAGQLSVPEDVVLSGLSAAVDVTCGLDADGYAWCWGDDAFGIVDEVPVAPFVALTVGPTQACGLRGTGSVLCWGNSPEGPIAPDAGGFEELDWGVNHGCGRTAEGWSCWGDDQYTQATMTLPLAQQVAMERAQSVDEMRRDRLCVLDVAGQIHCTGGVHYVTSPPSGEYRSIDSGYYIVGAIAADGSPVTWGHFAASHRLPDATYSEISIDYVHVCGVTHAGSVLCGGSDVGDVVVGDGWEAVAAGYLFGCAMADGVPSCWGANPPSPEGAPFVALDAGDRSMCGISAADRSVHCDGLLRFATSEGTYDEVDVGDLVACATRTDGGVQCWGYPSALAAAPGIVDAPTEGDFIDVSAGSGTACAVRADGEVVCWGLISRGRTLDD